MGISSELHKQFTQKRELVFIFSFHLVTTISWLIILLLRVMNFVHTENLWLTF